MEGATASDFDLPPTEPPLPEGPFRKYLLSCGLDKSQVDATGNALMANGYCTVQALTCRGLTKADFLECGVSKGAAACLYSNVVKLLEAAAAETAKLLSDDLRRRCVETETRVHPTHARVRVVLWKAEPRCLTLP